MGDLKIGVAAANVTPHVGVKMSGYGGRTDGAAGVRDELHSKALVLDDGTTRVAVVTNDLIGFKDITVNRIREEVERNTDIHASNVLVSCSHTHGGPRTDWQQDADDLDEGQPHYMELLFHKIAGAVTEAERALQPATMAHASTDVRIGINRRERGPDRKVVKIGRDPDGVILREAHVVRFDPTEGDGPIAMLFWHPCHGTTLGGDNLLLTADWAGHAQAFIEQAFPGTTALYCNGCSGDINPDPRGTFEWAEAHGTCMGGAVVKAAIDALEGDVTAEAEIAVAEESLELPLQDPMSEDECRAALAEAEAEMEKTESTFWVSRRVKGLKEQLEATQSGKVAGGLPITLQAIRVNDLALVGLPGEILTEIGMEIARRSPVPITLPVSHTNGSIGYVPPEHEVQYGGYEIENARARHQARSIAPNADSVLIAGALAALSGTLG